MKDNVSNYIECKFVVLLILYLFISIPISSQYKFRYNDDFPMTATFGSDAKNSGFRVSFSLVAMFTAGVADRNGLRLGGGVTLSQTIDNWTFSVGIDAYKARQKFGVGTSFAGLSFDDGRFGGSYYINKYHQGDKQISGIVGVFIADFKVNFEDDILAYPFTGFKIYDRYRSAALELRYKGFLAGMNIYTTGVNGLTDVSLKNSRGVYVSGRQVSSPVYIGYTTNNLILRYGISNNMTGVISQNSWHRNLFDTPDFKSGNYFNHFVQLGVDKPYTLY